MASNTVQGKNLYSFHEFPSQRGLPPSLHFSQKDKQAFDAAMVLFIQQHIVGRATDDFSGFCSNFPQGE